MSREEIKDAVKEALREEIEPLYVDREKHYLHHQFIENLIEWMENTKTTIWGALLRLLVYVVLVLLLGGVVWWGKEHLK